MISCSQKHAQDEQTATEIAQPPTKTSTGKKTSWGSKKSHKVTENKQEEVITPPNFTPKMPGKRVAQVNIPGKYVAVTFDDGPNPANTPKVLDIFKRYGAKATFFVLGELATQHKGIIARAAAEGHEIASHTWSHIKMTGSSDEKIISEMDRTNAVIIEATGRRPSLMRPPYGATNQHIMDMMMDRYGMTSVLWNVDTQDWKHPGVDVVVNRVLSAAQNGSIILLHDIHASTLAAVESIVSGLQQRGFRLVTVSELIEMGRQAASSAGLAAEPPAPPAAPATQATPATEADNSNTAVSISPTVASTEASATPTQEAAYPSEDL